ncbi:hypothetical protein Tco_0970728 [Tanacetum coccineum]
MVQEGWRDVWGWTSGLGPNAWFRRDGKMFGAGLLDFHQILEHLAEDPNMMVANTGETTIDSHAPNTNLQSEDRVVNSVGDKGHDEEHTNYVVNIWAGC